ncbi:MAG: ATP-binding protein [Sneathiella sp.]
MHDIYLPVAEDNNLELKLIVQKGREFNIQGDIELLTQMVVNLVENSLNHCPVNSKIEIELGHNSSSIFLYVKDNGPGIPLAERELVMERLYQVEKSRTTAGSGLDLSLVKAVAELHNFDIELADNKPGLIVKITAS